ncbi:MAG TPA: CmcJ/NvfI family oxidoreductase [Candidatus Limnocylindria bacterium]|nr:CmcJ/NvfI family oxidoreductase [Candidatus Limnocylindria bacterium]
MSRAESVEEIAPAFEALLHYLADTTEAPESYGGISQSEADQKRKGKYAEHSMPIYNGRAVAHGLSLERQGFILVDHNTQVKNFYDEAEVRSVYYKETEELVKRITGAKRVLVFDHTLRAADSAIREKNQVSSPVRNAHNDYTEWSGPQRVRDLLPQEADDLLSRRFAVVQTWRPINKPVQNEHLAIADARSIGTNELVPSARIYPNRRGEVYHSTYNPEHRWYYFPNMQRNEAMVFKCYDSSKDGRARWTAHCAFDDPTAPTNVPPRESIEMRTLAFF